MGRRSRHRRSGSRAAGGPGQTPSGRVGEKLAAPTQEYTDDEGNVLTLRGSLTPASRRSYSETRSRGLDQDDAWQRATEMLFERLAVSWTIAGLETGRQKELLMRYRMASSSEREFVRSALRAHLAEHFPELQAP